METYTDTIIVDCNRLNSIQGQNKDTSNNALFTNNIGDGVRLNTGDEISVHGAFISEVGAASDTIEFKGNTIYDSENKPKTKSLSYTKETELYPEESWYGAYQLIMGGYQASLNQEDTKTIELKDNETTIQTQFYTSNNGRGYCFLPRRFAYDQNYDGVNSSNVVNKIWTDSETLDTGVVYNYPRYQTLIEEDFQFYRSASSYPNNSKYEFGLYIPRNDNKRFTILKRSGTTFYRNQIVRFDGGLPITPNMPGHRDPALQEYLLYKKLIDIKVSKGMNSPSDISKQITDQLKKSSDPKKYNVFDGTGISQHVTTTFKANTWQPMRCASYEIFGFSHFREYDNSEFLLNPNDAAFKYYSCYENIAVKRPDLFLAGRQCNDFEGKEIQSEILHSQRATATIKTDYLYDTDTLQTLSNLFKIQGLYPELFRGNSFSNYLQQAGARLSIDNCRFLHMNTEANIDQFNMLGNDSYREIPAGSGINGSNLSSIPVYFAYQPQFADIETGGTDTNRLSYGFAMKYRHPNGNDYIEFRPDLILGMADFSFQRWKNNASGFVPYNIEEGRKFGWDWHFSAYSTLAMILWGGRMDRDYLNNNEWAIQNASQSPSSSNGITTNIADLITQRYIGANDPLFDFDSIKQRFNFSRLHTAETIGQPSIIAGISYTDAPQINGRYANEVYKINPRFNQWEYCPNLKPYIQSMSASWTSFAGTTSNDVQQIGIMSRQVDPYTIFDSNCGIFISDFGYNKDDFNEGLWAILGFTYDQFNASITDTNNRLIRVNEDNKNNLGIITTNCEVVVDETSYFNVNNYGAIFPTDQVSAPQCIVGPYGLFVDGVESDHGAGLHLTIPFFPPITEETNSIKIDAVNLPRKMLRPYYLIRSDVINQSKFIGADNSLMPVVMIADKQYSGGDFYFSSDNTLSFRVTKPTIISNITTSIHDPDGTFANLNEDSSIIYKFIRNKKVDVDILSDYLNQKKK
jgi:hypothetical protein